MPPVRPTFSKSTPSQRRERKGTQRSFLTPIHHRVTGAKALRMFAADAALKRRSSTNTAGLALRRRSSANTADAALKRRSSTPADDTRNITPCHHRGHEGTQRNTNRGSTMSRRGHKEHNLYSPQRTERITEENGINYLRGLCDLCVEEFHTTD